MNNDEELIALVRKVNPVLDDPARVGVADWLDAHPEHQRTRVLWSRPRGLLKWFTGTARPRLAGQYPPWRLKSPAVGRWNYALIWNFLANEHSYPIAPGRPSHWRWTDHGGFSVIAGRWVLVGEPDGTEDQSQVTAALLQQWLGTPVTYDRVGRRGRGARRIVIWYDLCDAVCT